MGIYKKGANYPALKSGLTLETVPWTDDAGGHGNVPSNTLPDGLAMSGTKTDDWPGAAKSVRMKAASDTKG